jgi:hypothetical protein
LPSTPRREPHMSLVKKIFSGGLTERLVEWWDM